LKKVLAVFGTRPEAIKMAPVVKALANNASLRVITAVTAQHREMLDQVLELFRIQPEYDLNIMQAGQSLTEITARVLSGMKGILERERPDLVLVHGDTSTTFAAGLAAFYRRVPVGHVEAGLRTGHKYAPYPEEMNRKLTACLTDLHFAPTDAAKANLLREGVTPDRIVVTGNTVIDALLETVRPDYFFQEAFLNKIDFHKKKVILVTAHRRENLGAPLREILAAVKTVVLTNLEAEVIFPVHYNPEVRGPAREILGDLERVHLVEPLDYEPFANLMNRCYLVLTDSGGIQEEAPALGKPVLVLRETTERPEAVRAGTVKLVGTVKEAIVAAAAGLLQNKDEYLKMAAAVNPYGDGKAAPRIFQAALRFLGLSNESVTEYIWER